MKSALLFALLILAGNAAKTQVIYRNILFNEGDRYQKQVCLKSITTMQRGVQTLNLDANTSISRSYSVSGIAVNSYSFKITTEKVADTLKGMGQQMEYDSEKPTAAGSILAKTLKRLIGKSTNVVIDKTGKIMAVSNNFSLRQVDSIMNLSSLLADKIIVGNALELIARLPPSHRLKKGSKWIDTVLSVGGNEIIHCIIESITDSTTTISFKGNGIKNHNYVKGEFVIKDHSTSIITGYMIVDNNTSIVTKRFINVEDNGSQTINGISVATGKKSTIVETVKKL